MRTNSVISLLLPTRGRPALAQRFLQSVVTRSERRDLVEAIIYADEDDPDSHGLNVEGISLRTIVGPRVSMGRCNTACLENAAGSIVILANDDIVIQTPGWDRHVREVDGRFGDKIFLAYPNDLYKGRRLCAFPILSRKTCELLQEPFPAAYAGAFIDYHLLDIFRRLERIGIRRICYLEHVVFEHMHFRAGKAHIDDTYRERRRFGDDDTFLALADSRCRAAGALASAITDSVRVHCPRRYFVGNSGLLGKINQIAVAILGDHGLPWRWRTFLFLWFVGRLLAAKVAAGTR